jgi:hypothetical protein
MMCRKVSQEKVAMRWSDIVAATLSVALADNADKRQNRAFFRMGARELMARESN